MEGTQIAALVDDALKETDGNMQQQYEHWQTTVKDSAEVAYGVAKPKQPRVLDFVTNAEIARLKAHATLLD